MTYSIKLSGLFFIFPLKYKPMVIAIDGPAGSGKSTVAGLLAKRLGYTFVNSGNLYRVLTLGCFRLGIDARNEREVIDYARQANIGYHENMILLDGENITGYLHSDDIDKNVSAFSSIVAVRHIVNDIIHAIARTHDVVVEGRDMTTVVFPDAEHRFYLDASVEARTKRRLEQGVSALSFEAIKATIIERDTKDRNKVEGSLEIGKNVVYVDTSLLTIEESCEKLLKSIQGKG